MEYSKLWQYENVVKQSALSYSGNLAVKLNDGTQYNVSSPVNTINNAEINTDELIIDDTLDSQYGDNMKFSITFKLHSDAISLGTKNILTMPGLASFITEHNTIAIKLLWTNSVYQYVPATSIINGWNDVSLVGDGQLITLTVNEHVYVVAGRIYDIIYSGFSGSNYLSIPNIFTSNMSSFKLSTMINLISSTGISNAGIIDTINNTSIRLTITTEGYLHLRVSTAGGQSYEIDITGSNVLPNNKNIIVEVLYNSSTGYVLQHTIDGNTTVDGTSSVTTAPYSNGSDYYIGINSALTYDYKLQGSLSLYNTIFERNGIVVFNGSTAVKGTGYTVIGSPTETIDGVVYPYLKLGKLTTYQSWMLLKDIEALKLED